jgi:hypothetical protein
MRPVRPFRTVCTIFGVIMGTVSIVGALILMWGSQDVMLVAIHWIGEERVLGQQNVIRQSDGSKLLTNPSAMARVIFLVWFVSLSHLIAGSYLFWQSVKKSR